MAEVSSSEQIIDAKLHVKNMMMMMMVMVMVMVMILSNKHELNQTYIGIWLNIHDTWSCHMISWILSGNGEHIMYSIELVSNL